MRRTKNCVFKYRIENIFKINTNTAVSAYSENREKQYLDFEAFSDVTLAQLARLRALLGTPEIRIAAVLDYESENLAIQVLGVKYPEQAEGK